ncbi:uncharacterized protein LOC122036751 [Zingiber officinale]|uniref:uncharacterized protein LOC121971882 n=1 Tax=Zingiber officinale TaxID=94328 RepID=UPI001C4C5A14|nr:uncharacterized protein LOC121971882 [Zingiber officinale]XP_042452090.1 uncharacterized protein LOC122036751 [Zingiber officinale]
MASSTVLTSPSVAAAHLTTGDDSTRRRHFWAKCSLPLPPPLPRDAPTSTRRAASIALLFLLGGFSAHSKRADAANPFDKYLKRKKLDPLESYVPAVLLSRAQFEDLEKFLDSKQPNYDISRSLLRSGPAASLRINIRAVAQYATEDGNGKAASDAVEQCLRALEDLDSLLLNAIRNDPRASTESMKGKLDIVLGSLDSLLQTVPSKVLDQGKAIADAYMDPSYQSDKPAVSDTEITKLEALF